MNLGGEASKHGFPPDGLAEAVGAARRRSSTCASWASWPSRRSAATPEASRPWFRRLRALRDELAARPEWRGWPGWLSMGMSDDFEVAIEEGATHVRVGTALFGPRQ